VRRTLFQDRLDPGNVSARVADSTNIVYNAGCRLQAVRHYIVIALAQSLAEFLFRQLSKFIRLHRSPPSRD